MTDQKITNLITSHDVTRKGAERIADIVNAGAARKEVTPVPSSQEYWGRTFIQSAAGSRDKPSQHFAQRYRPGEHSYRH